MCKITKEILVAHCLECPVIIKHTASVHRKYPFVRGPILSSEKQELFLLCDCLSIT